MSKDSYWFRHDSNAGRGLRMRKIHHIYGHEGKGFYWDVVEVLRDQSGYKYPNNETDLQMLASIIGAKDESKFLNFVKDCIRFDLFSVKDNFLYCKVLTYNMKVWETKKRNASGIKAKSKRNAPIIEQKIIEDNSRGEYKNPQVGFVPPTLLELKAFFKEKGYTEARAVQAFNHYEASDWKNTMGHKLTNWKQSMINNWFKPEFKAVTLTLSKPFKK